MNSNRTCAARIAADQYVTARRLLRVASVERHPCTDDIGVNAVTDGNAGDFCARL